eukprot:1272943-Prymnesium_polylepis.1
MAPFCCAPFSPPPPRRSLPLLSDALPNPNPNSNPTLLLLRGAVCLFSLMLSTGIPELQKAEDIHWLRDSLRPSLGDDAAAEYFARARPAPPRPRPRP